MPADWMKTDKNLQDKFDSMKENKKFTEQFPTYDKFCETINPNFKPAESSQPPAGGESNGDSNK